MLVVFVIVVRVDQYVNDDGGDNDGGGVIDGMAISMKMAQR